MGLAATASPGDGVPARGVAQFAAAVGGETLAAAAVEAALVAAQTADRSGGEQQADDPTRRMAAAGRACGAALRDVLDALGADGTLG
eukprot:3871931-Pleurochrysis_carterae.AAC.1